MTATSIGVLAAVVVVLVAVVVQTAGPARAAQATRSRLMHNRPHENVQSPLRRVLRRLSKRLSPVDDERILTLTLPILGALLVGPIMMVAFVGAVPAFVLVLVEIIAVPATYKYLRQRERDLYEASVPLALDAMAASLRSGAGLVVAMHDVSSSQVGMSGRDFALMCREIDKGRRVVEALDAWATRRPLRCVRLTAAAMALAVETGGAQAKALDGVAATVRQRLDARTRAKTAATESKASAFALTILPAVISGPVLVLSADARYFMFHTSVGATTFVVGVLLDVIGAFVMAQMIRRSFS